MVQNSTMVAKLRKCHNLRLFMACFACENPSPFYLSERSLHRWRWSERSDDHQRRLCSLPQASTKIMTIFSTSFQAGISSNIKSIRLGFGLGNEELIFPLTRCLKVTEKVSFNIASEASYVYILRGQKLIKNAKNGPFWRVFENLKLAVKQSYQTGQ